mmetsp:Transcript_9341/g.28846  ORF Transcript_9341/g.28846 Transcript_9341/m.28846 type:complete len:179 (-) Transcript_9341:385-921(-)
MLGQLQHRLGAVGVLVVVAVLLSLLLFLSAPSSSRPPAKPEVHLSSTKSPQSLTQKVPVPLESLLGPSNTSKPSLPAPNLPPTCINIYGFQGCGFHRRARRCASSFSDGRPNVSVHVRTFTRPEYHKVLSSMIQSRFTSKRHRTSPLVFLGCTDEPFEFIGGADQFTKYLRTEEEFIC